MPVIVKGTDGILSWWDGSAYKPIGCLSDFDIAISRAVVTRETLCNPGVIEKRPGNQDTTVNFSGFYANTDAANGGDATVASFDDILPVIQQGLSGDFRIQAYEGTTPKNYYVSGFISELNAGWSAGDEDATFSGVIAVDGLVEETDPNAPT